jgi:hypothetical protein
MPASCSSTLCASNSKPSSARNLPGFSATPTCWCPCREARPRPAARGSRRILHVPSCTKDWGPWHGPVCTASAPYPNPQPPLAAPVPRSCATSNRSRWSDPRSTLQVSCSLTMSLPRGERCWPPPPAYARRFRMRKSVRSHCCEPWDWQPALNTCWTPAEGKSDGKAETRAEFLERNSRAAFCPIMRRACALMSKLRLAVARSKI